MSTPHSVSVEWVHPSLFPHTQRLRLRKLDTDLAVSLPYPSNLWFSTGGGRLRAGVEKSETLLHETHPERGKRSAHTVCLLSLESEREAKTSRDSPASKASGAHVWGCACFPVSSRDGTDINCLICKRQRLGIIIFNSKVSLVSPSWAPARCYPQASWGLKAPIQGTGWRGGGDQSLSPIKHMWKTGRPKMFQISPAPPQELGGHNPAWKQHLHAVVLN